MKRILISLLVLVGVGGLIGLLSYHPKSAAVGSKDSSKSDPASSNGSVAGSSASPSSSAKANAYRDGNYTGSKVDSEFGPIQVQAVISGGKLTDVKFLQMPNDRQHSIEVTNEAEPLLLQEAVQAQSAQIDTVSGATQDTEAFSQSLQSALSQAKA
jgi:uncharacterized protein with FMN-binding domain